MDVDGLVLFVARTQNAIYAYSLDGSGGGTYKNPTYGVYGTAYHTGYNRYGIQPQTQPIIMCKIRWQNGRTHL